MTAVTVSAASHRTAVPFTAVVGVGYTASWIAGLSIWPNNLRPSSTGAEVVAAFTGHQAVGAAQYLLTEGLPAVGLAVVGLALAAAARRAGMLRSARVAAVSAVTAATVSAVQCLLGLVLLLAVVPRGGVGTSHLLFELVNRMDGVKMFALAVLAVSGAVLSGAGVAARWLRHPAHALAVTIAASGVGYLLLLDSLAPFAYLSLPLLLLWVTGSGITLSRRAR